MVESRVPAAIDAIYTLLKDAGLNVFDGPSVTGDADTSAVFIGYDGLGTDSEFNVTSTSQRWAGIGLRRRNEEYSIVCAAVVVVGDGTWKSTRDAVFGLLDQVGATLRQNVDLGIEPPSVAELIPGTYYQEPGPNGFQARIVFEIRHQTRV